MTFCSIIILLLTVFAFPFNVQTKTTSFNFTEFTQTMFDIVFEGDATVVIRAIKLTKSFDDLNSNDSVSRATYFKPIHLWDKDSGKVSDFTTYFSFAINSKDNERKGNGFEFFLANKGYKVQASSENGHLGLSNATDVHPFVAVEFDTGYSPKWTRVIERST
ncbi:lectin precursor, putative [Ricinus communis]|uniref:Lectin, putative n=1 Tax=Ricinus communis TaxID=3988 RepID=B9S3C8_RICCO|nr:lectin precursor, putative [Ricinus communis]